MKHDQQEDGPEGHGHETKRQQDPSQTHDHEHHKSHHRHGHEHGTAHDHKTRFHDPRHAAEFDSRSTMAGIRGGLTTKLIEMMELKGHERVLDLATGTGRVARPAAKHLTSGRIIGVDQAMAMLEVGHDHQEGSERYSQIAGEAGCLPFKANVFDRAFVSFSLHHFANPAAVVREVLRVLKNGGTFVVLDPVIEESRDAVDVALETKINQVFRRTHGDEFRFHTAGRIQQILLKEGYVIARASVVTYPFDQEGMDGIPTGRHWLEAAEELEAEAPELAQRMRESYFTWHRHDDHVHVKGSFSYALISAQKPA